MPVHSSTHKTRDVNVTVTAKRDSRAGFVEYTPCLAPDELSGGIEFTDKSSPSIFKRLFIARDNEFMLGMAGNENVLILIDRRICKI